MQFKNIIFDLGGVILNLSVSNTIEAFSNLSGRSPQEVAHLFRTSDGFEKYERGELSDAEFRDFVRELYDVNVGDDDIDRCWNAMLLDLPEERLKLLARLKERHQTFLLSNTNTIHLDHINTHVLPPASGKPVLDSYFHESYYSHFMGKRKPEPEIFLEVIEENFLNPRDTLFLDDNPDNVAGARAVGLHAVHVNTENFILHYFS